MYNEVSPPGWSGTVKAMKRHPEISNPYALSWWMKKRGAKAHYKPEKKRMNFKEYLSLDEAMSYTTALDFVFGLLRLPPPNTQQGDVEDILTMPIKGYGRDAVEGLMREPQVRSLPNFQTEILPALTKDGTTVGKLVSLLSNAEKQVTKDAPEPDEHTPEPDHDKGIF